MARPGRPALELRLFDHQLTRGAAPGHGGAPRPGKVAARLARVAHQFRYRPEYKRLVFFSDGGIDFRLRNTWPDRPCSVRIKAADAACADTAPAATAKAPSRRDVKGNERAAEHNVLKAAAAAARAPAAQPERATAPGTSDGDTPTAIRRRQR